MADDKQYYVKVAFDFGVDNEDGTFTSKNPGNVEWLSMPYDNAVGLQNYAVIPALKMLIERAGELGLLVTDLDFPGKDALSESAGNAGAAGAQGSKK